MGITVRDLALVKFINYFEFQLNFVVEVKLVEDFIF